MMNWHHLTILSLALSAVPTGVFAGDDKKEHRKHHKERVIPYSPAYPAPWTQPYGHPYGTPGVPPVYSGPSYHHGQPPYYSPLGPRHYGPGWSPRPFSQKDLERHIERTVKAHFGRGVKDVDVDVDSRRGRVRVEAEVRHPFLRGSLAQLLYSLPELQGYAIHLDVEYDD